MVQTNTNANAKFNDGVSNQLEITLTLHKSKYALGQPLYQYFHVQCMSVCKLVVRLYEILRMIQEMIVLRMIQ